MSPNTPPPSERRLVECARGGDQEAFDSLVLAHQARLRAYVARFVSSSQDVYDIVQDAFLAAYRSLHTCDPDRPFGPWLHGICRHHLCAFLRKRDRSSSVIAAIDIALAEYAQADDTPPVRDGSRLEALRECLQQLSDEHQRLITWRYFRSTPLEELATQTSKSASALAMLLMRLRSRLRECVTMRVEGADA